MGWVSYAEDFLSRSQSQLDSSNLLLRHARPDLRNEFEAAIRARDVAQDVLDELRSLLELATDPSVDAAAELAQIRKRIAQLEGAENRARRAEDSVVEIQEAYDQVRRELEERSADVDRYRRQLYSEQGSLREIRKVSRDLSARNEKVEMEQQAARALNLKERLYQNEIQDLQAENESLLRTKGDVPRETADLKSERVRFQTYERSRSEEDQTMSQLASEHGIRWYNRRGKNS
jgi:hypothetical protein